MSLQSDLSAFAQIYEPAGIILRDYLLYLQYESLTNSGIISGSNQKQVNTTNYNTATSYAINQSIGGLKTIPGVFSGTGKNGQINSVILKLQSTLTPALAVCIFDQEPTSSTITNGVAMAISAADRPKLKAVINVIAANWFNVANIGTVNLRSFGQAIQSNDSNGNLFIAIQAKSAVVFPLANVLDIDFDLIQNP